MNINLDEFEIYKGKSFASLCREIVVNQQSKKDQLNVLIEELRPLIKTVEEAIVIVPILNDYFDVGVKNDEQLVKLAAVIQKIITRNDSSGQEDSLLITDDEKKELLKSVEELTKSSEEISIPKATIKVDGK